ncbi:flagellar basal body P-ring formation chaperone FlgA [Candidatus Latescibacterota bacterium]
MLITILLFSISAVPIHAVVIPADDIRDAVSEYVSGLSVEENIEYGAEVPGLFDVTVENVEKPVIEVSHDVEKELRQIIPVTVTIKDSNGEAIRQLRLSPRLKKYAIAAVLNRNIKRGEIIGKSDVDIKKADITGIDNFYVSGFDVVGMETEKYLKAEAVISKSDVRKPYIVRRGDKVSVEIRSEGILLKTDGTARENGLKDDFIKIYVDMTKTTIFCKIVDSKTVVAGIEGG